MAVQRPGMACRRKAHSSPPNRTMGSLNDHIQFTHSKEFTSLVNISSLGASPTAQQYPFLICRMQRSFSLALQFNSPSSKSNGTENFNI